MSLQQVSTIVKEFKNVEVTQSKVLSAGQGVEEEAE